MSLYVNTSALLKLYVEEPDSVACEALLVTDPDWVTARHTLVEARRNLRLPGNPCRPYPRSRTGREGDL